MYTDADPDQINVDNCIGNVWLVTSMMTHPPLPPKTDSLNFESNTDRLIPYICVGVNINGLRQRNHQENKQGQPTSEAVPTAQKPKENYEERQQDRSR